jgi:hypothetical protein
MKRHDIMMLLTEGRLVLLLQEVLYARSVEIEGEHEIEVKVSIR